MKIVVLELLSSWFESWICTRNIGYFVKHIPFNNENESPSIGLRFHTLKVPSRKGNKKSSNLLSFGTRAPKNIRLLIVFILF